jgi:hypothetical protein
MAEAIPVHLTVPQTAWLYFSEGASGARFLRKVASSIRDQVPHGGYFYFSLDKRGTTFFFDEDGKGEYVAGTAGSERKIYLEDPEQIEGGSAAMNRSGIGEAILNIQSFWKGKLFKDFDSTE